MEANHQNILKAVVFDIGETLLDDTRECAEWADYLGVRRNTFAAVLGATNGDFHKVFRIFKPDFQGRPEYENRVRAGRPQRIEEEDIYDDVRPALKSLQNMGLWVGVAGNQAIQVSGLLAALELPVDQIATSAEWGVSKPSPQFFDRVAEMVPCERHEILYVGDHIDNDVRAAHAAGMQAALLRRGPWGWLSFDEPDSITDADWAVHSLTELAELIAASQDQRVKS